MKEVVLGGEPLPVCLVEDLVPVAARDNSLGGDVVRDAVLGGDSTAAAAVVARGIALDGGGVGGVLRDVVDDGAPRGDGDIVEVAAVVVAVRAILGGDVGGVVVVDADGAHDGSGTWVVLEEAGVQRRHGIPYTDYARRLADHCACAQMSCHGTPGGRADSGARMRPAHVLVRAQMECAIEEGLSLLATAEVVEGVAVARK